MKEINNIEQIEKGLAKKHGRYLQSLVYRFCQFLNRQTPPHREEIRKKFLDCEYEWKVYCVRHNLGIRASMMFNAKIAYEWETKYAKPQKTQRN